MIRLRSVREKLLLMVLVANFFTLVAAGATLLYHDLLENRNKTANELTALADILGQARPRDTSPDERALPGENGNVAEKKRQPANVESASGAGNTEYHAVDGDDRRRDSASQRLGTRGS